MSLHVCPRVRPERRLRNPSRARCLEETGTRHAKPAPNVKPLESAVVATQGSRREQAIPQRSAAFCKTLPAECGIVCRKQPVAACDRLCWPSGVPRNQDCSRRLMPSRDFSRLFSERRAWDSNPQPIAGHLISSRLPLIEKHTFFTAENGLLKSLRTHAQRFFGSPAKYSAISPCFACPRRYGKRHHPRHEDAHASQT